MSKTIIVTGASRGIGLSIVKQFSKEKENTIYALSRNIDLMNRSFKEFENVHPLKIDLSENLDRQLAGLIKEIKEVDILINNAGVLIKKPFNEITQEDLLLSYQTNVFSVIKIVQLLLSKFKTNAHILNISSMGAFQGSVKFPELISYSSSKAALCNFTEAFAEEHKNKKINMNCLCLGAVQTEMLNEAFPGYKAQVSSDEMADYICDFAKNGQQYFNGKIIPVSLSTP